MNSVTLISALVLVAVILLVTPQSAHAECCYGMSGSNICGDCTKTTPYCGVSRCSIFGCDCHGGCRDGQCGRSSRGKRSADGNQIDSGEGVVNAGDLNNDGVLSLLEAEMMLQAEGIAVEKHIVKRMDANQDGALSADEIDIDY